MAGVSGTGNIVDSAVIDTFSENPSATYNTQPHGGANKTYATIYSGNAPVVGLDPLSVPTIVTGIPKAPPAPAIPPTLPRAPIQAIVNSAARGVYFESTLVPVIGDGIPGPGALPSPRLLTTPGKYSTIFIGTRT